MIRLLVILALGFGTAFAQAPLTVRVADAIRSHAVLSDDAEIRILQITPVRGAVQSVEVSRFDRRTGQFDAVIAHGEYRASISGRAHVSVPVVVANQTLRRGHVLGAADIELRQVSIAQVPANAFTLPEDLVGSAVRRSLAAGRPVREDDIGLPIIIQQNQSIEIVYETAGMTLMARGRSLDEGARGDFIRIMTDGQGKIVSGEIAGPGRVVVR